MFSLNFDFRHCFHLFMTLFLFLVFLYFAFESWDKYSQKRISTSIQEKKGKNFLYHSITVCPEATFRAKVNILPAVKIRSLPTVKKIYLTNVRSLEEVFFFVNQKLWSQDGHKCLTQSVSEDPGRPCVFPFTKVKEKRLKRRKKSRYF